MTSTHKLFQLRISFWLWSLLLASTFWAGRGEAQTASFSLDGQSRGSAISNKKEDQTIPALLVSDIHFDPFHDPSKAQQLVDSPVSQWRSILSAPPSRDEQQAFAALQQKCHGRGVDTPYLLLQSSLQAMRSRQPAKFITVSGDLIAHSFYCRYTTLASGAKPADYQAFVLKTLSFVVGELRDSFPGVAIYAALGNNDTSCDDYKLDAGSDFLDQAGKILATGLPSSQQQEVMRMFAKGGYYNLTMAAPMRDTRLIVINDLFMSPKYRACAGASDSAAAAAEMAWLRDELTDARKAGRRVWVMGHIPPGVDPYSTAVKVRDICGKEDPEMFLSSDQLADLLIEYADVVRLGLFGHSHMDEMRLLEPKDHSRPASFQNSVAIKIVPSISPVDGNNPSFTIARINPSSAVLQDYEVIAASNQTGVATTWSTEYDYGRAYHEAQFSPAAVKKLIREFENDGAAKTEASEQYLRNYFVGDRSSQLKVLWRPYVCALANHTGKAFAACVCSAAQ